MDTKRFALAVLAVFIFVFLFEFVVHGILLKGMYIETAHLWRAEEDSKMIFIMLGQILLSLVATFMFTKLHGVEFFNDNGMKFGILIGLILASPTIASYCYMPVPFALWISWVGAELTKGIGAGITISLVYPSDAQRQAL
ncbi:MAG: hypothetical protein HN472_10190 [Nitrospina sp.]|nr:hypothetical protein [Nitrospina sp.]MBT3874474.1 hypothetical protein [Nitrospina sp.]MBT4049106.1 hypothetical protein [Nitrospina sp.]MBT4559144.1 hypothetical protein [Nitrospina sp.]MBT5347810.1 hypothetical protein [Nitrospina sp.]